MKKIKSRIVLFLAIISFVVLSFSTVAYAATGTLSAHTIGSGTTTFYYSGNGYSLAEGDRIEMDATLSQEYQYSTGTKNVTTGLTFTYTHGFLGKYPRMRHTVTSTALYYTWIRNDSSVTMYVLSGTVTY